MSLLAQALPMYHSRPFCLSPQTSSVLLMNAHSNKRRFRVRVHSEKPKQSNNLIDSLCSSSVGFVVAGIFGIGDIFMQNAFAEESAAPAPLPQAPEWLGPAILSLPLVSYVIFSVYRDKVNPRVKISDWLLLLAAVVIAANVISILTLRVRIY
eukprot:TRINITY_DN2271_c0_g1_i1.p1 TRINITY_DN2271_c0_g1~~TRINITY_DN2271_c0_g1_i1.p1  ORF type:complete len:153 (+),score=5.92 TRINITY_DN2271_c0_g1_i1:140-598(+)